MWVGIEDQERGGKKKEKNKSICGVRLAVEGAGILRTGTVTLIVIRHFAHRGWEKTMGKKGRVLHRKAGFGESRQRKGGKNG